MNPSFCCSVTMINATFSTVQSTTTSAGHHIVMAQSVNTQSGLDHCGDYEINSYSICNTSYLHRLLLKEFASSQRCQNENGQMSLLISGYSASYPLSDKGAQTRLELRLPPAAHCV